MIVYRIENDNGVGPYCSARVMLTMLRQHNADRVNHPVGYVDGIDWSDDGVYGFDNIQKLRDWFRGFVAPLMREGYSIVKYDVPDHHVRMSQSKLQLTFDRSEAVEISRRKRAVA